jgi:hypothetical protein
MSRIPDSAHVHQVVAMVRSHLCLTWMESKRAPSVAARPQPGGATASGHGQATSVQYRMNLSSSLGAAAGKSSVAATAAPVRGGFSE